MLNAKFMRVAVVNAALFSVFAVQAIAAPCVHLTASVSPSSAKPGQTVFLKVGIANCSGAAETINLVVAVSGPGFLHAVTLHPTLPEGLSHTLDIPFTIPLFATPGTYKLTLKAYSGATLLATATASLVVT